MRIVSRMFFVFSFLLLFSVSINAYTLVMRGGGRVEIPDNFIVTTVGVSYTVGNGIGVTVQMTNIDIAATERANKETAGSFLSRITQVKKTETQKQQPSSTQKPANTITNLDLNSYRVARERDEAAYEQNRAAMGFPSREELQKRNEEESQKLRAISEQQDQQEAQAESYWRNRANALRTEIYTLNAEIGYVRARINEEPTYTVFYSYIPPRQNVNTPPLPTANVYEPATPVRQRNVGVNGSINFGGGSTQGSVGFYYQGSSASYYPNNGIDAFGYYPYYGFAPPFPVRYQSYNRMQLVSRLQSLEQSRIGLLARWKLLEEEARRAGALPGWLR